MELIFPIVLGALVLASFFIAYMSSKTWPAYQAVLVAFIFLGTLAFFVLGRGPWPRTNLGASWFDGSSRKPRPPSANCSSFGVGSKTLRGRTCPASFRN